MTTIVSPECVDVDAIQRLADEIDNQDAPLRLDVPSGPIELPDEIVDVLLAVIKALREGNGFTVMPLAAALTTAQAAEILNVSRSYVAKLINDGELPYSTVDGRRRVSLADILQCKERRDRVREEALAEMHAIAGEAGMVL